MPCQKCSFLKWWRRWFRQILMYAADRGRYAVWIRKWVHS